MTKLHPAFLVSVARFEYFFQQAAGCGDYDAGVLGGGGKFHTGRALILRLLRIEWIGADKNRDTAGYRVLPSEFFGGAGAVSGQSPRQFSEVGEFSAEAAGTDDLLFVGRDFFQLQTGYAVQFQHGSGDHDIKFSLYAFARLTRQVPDGLDARS